MFGILKFTEIHPTHTKSKTKTKSMTKTFAEHPSPEKSWRLLTFEILVTFLTMRTTISNKLPLFKRATYSHDKCAFISDFESI